MTLEELVNAVLDNVQERDNGEYYANCCFCDDTKQRLGVNVYSGVMHCFKCDASCGDKRNARNSRRLTFNKICDATNYPGQFTIEDEDDIATKIKFGKDSRRAKKTVVSLPRGFEPLWRDIDDEFGRKALSYLRERRITKEQIKKFGLGFAVVGDYAWRIVFPVYYGTKLKGLVGRDFTGQSEVKYLNSTGLKTLYNIPKKKFRQKKALLVEGVFDVLACDRAKLKGIDVIGCLGSKLTNKQLEMLKGYLRIIIWAEPDRAGVEGSIKRAKQLADRGAKVYIVIPDRDPELDTDPGALEDYEIKDRVKGAKRYSSGVCQIMRTRIAFSSSPKKKKGKLKW